MVKKILAVLLCVLVLLSGMTAMADGVALDEEQMLLTVLLNAAGAQNAPIFAYGDYDADGKGEAFALIGEQTQDGYYGSLWFISTERCLCLRQNQSYLTIAMVGNDAPLMFSAWERQKDGSFVSYIWGVEAGQIRPISIAAAENKPVNTLTEEIAVSENSIGYYKGDYQVTASSYFTGNLNPVYGWCAMDGSLVTAWNSNNRITDEWLKITVKDGEEYEIAGVRIAAGYWKNPDVYNYNSRPKTISVYCDNEYVQTISLQDVKDYQTFWFDAPVVGSSIKLVMEDGYRGTAHYDCCITEVELLGSAGAYLSEDTLMDWGEGVKKAQKRIQNGGTISQGDYGLYVVGMQLLLREGFGIHDDEVDGSFGVETLESVRELARRMKTELPDCREMKDGVVDSAYWKNMIEYMEYIR